MACAPQDPQTTQNQTLRAYVAESLLSHQSSFIGVHLERQSAEDNGTLIHFNQSVDFILRDSLLLNINASTLETIMWFEGLRSATIEGLTATGCSSLSAVLSMQNCTSQVQVSRCQFENSAAGAIVLKNNAAVVRHCTFASLAQVKTGVAINVENNDGSPFTVTNCTFKDILAVSSSQHKLNGGAITALSPQVVISQSHFTNCSAWEGGAVNLYSEQLLNGSWPTTLLATIDLCTFESNLANSSGGALCFYGSSGFVSDTMIVTRSTFDNNHAVYGGAIFTSGIGYADIQGCTFRNNIAYQGTGGAVYLDGLSQRYTNVLLANSAFIDNSVPATAADGGIDGSSLDSLSLQSSCSGALVQYCACVGMWNCTFMNNFGSGLCLDNIAGLCVNPSYRSVYPNPLYDILFNASTLSRQGSSFVTYFTTTTVSVDVRASKFIGNEAHSFGNSHFRTFGNGLKSFGDLRGGGGISVNLVQYALFDDCMFKDNNAIQGGGMYLDGCTAIFIWNSVFDNNTAIGSGGAISSVNNHDMGVIVGASTIKNSWAQNGAGFYGGAGSSLTTTYGTSMVSNTAVSYGGAIHCVNCQQVTAEYGASLASNMAGEAGGACYCDGCVLFQLSNATLQKNSAGHGGGVVLANDNATWTLANITLSNFIDNIALTGDGGSMSVTGGITLLDKNTFLRSNAAARGGAVMYVQKCIDIGSFVGVEWGSGSSAEDPKNGVKFQLPNPLTVLESLGLNAKFLTQHEGRCSYLQVQQNKYLDNIAKYAGGVIYSTDRTSLNITCKEHVVVDNGSLDCGLPSWGGNNIGEHGYGPVIAFPPARVNTDMPSELTYVSNGVSKLSITAEVSDEAGTHITTGIFIRL
ncbi:TPA: hypothetical protein ACH3X1_000209 [Trebouxia sp. C0004]